MAGASVALTHCAADDQLLTCLDDLSFESCDRKAVMVIGATNRPDSLDAALRRAGRCVGLLCCAYLSTQYCSRCRTRSTPQRQTNGAHSAPQWCASTSAEGRRVRCECSCTKSATYCTSQADGLTCTHSLT